MADSAVINASPLIFLSRGRQLDLLKCITDKVIVPNPVAQEIRAKGVDDISAKALGSTAWLICQQPPATPEKILGWGVRTG